MAVNWNLGVSQTNALLGFQQGLERGRQHQRENMLMQRQQEQYDQQQQQAQQERIAQAAQALGPVYQHLQRMPYERRRAYLQQVAPRLIQRGIPAEIVNSYDPTDQNLETDIMMLPQAARGRPIVIDGVAMDPATGQAMFESPYDRIIPGPNGSFYRVPRMGIGRNGQPQQQPQGQVVQGQGGQLPPGWTPIEDDEGGPTQPASGGFP